METHEFEAGPGATGAACTAMVMRDGSGDTCNEPPGAPIHRTPRVRLDEAVPHGPGEACTCNGCWACDGNVVGCTCDIDWDVAFEARHD